MVLSWASVRALHATAAQNGCSAEPVLQHHAETPGSWWVYGACTVMMAPAARANLSL